MKGRLQTGLLLFLMASPGHQGIEFRHKFYKKYDPSMPGADWSQMVFHTIANSGGKVPCAGSCASWPEGKCTGYVYDQDDLSCHLTDVIRGGDGFLASQSSPRPFHLDTEILNQLDSMEFIRLTNVSLTSYFNETFLMNGTHSSASDLTCMASCFLTATCSVLIQNGPSCHFGSVSTTTLPNGSTLTGLARGDITVLTDVLNTSVAAHFDVKLDHVNGSDWSSSIFSVRTLLTNKPSLECQGYCMYEMDICGYCNWDSTNCYLGSFGMSTSLINSSDPALLNVNSANLQSYLDQQVHSVQSEPLVWRSYIYSSMPLADNLSCKAKCLFDKTCSYGVYEDGSCHLGNIENSTQSLSLNEGTDQDIFIFTNRGNQPSAKDQFISMELHPDTLSSRFFSLYNNVNSDEGCALLCFLHKGPCEFYYHNTTRCYVGRFLHNGNITAYTDVVHVSNILPADYVCNSTARQLELSSMLCDASSEYNADYLCEHAFGEENEWAPFRQGVGAWISVPFPKCQKIVQIDFLQRNKWSDVEEVEVTFSEGQSVVINLPIRRSDVYNEHQMNPMIESMNLRVDITKVYDSNDNGFSEIRVFGCNCS